MIQWQRNQINDKSMKIKTESVKENVCKSTKSRLMKTFSILLKAKTVYKKIN